ncbi:carbohydrate sulfotransferase 15-like [Littorina saxatilis]|uniref:Sulfotransferase domain-containing protein n=1 Tax=Littorina saxatilis TaxID=31220 RepID=A0AAN9AHX4_9CAEN
MGVGGLRIRAWFLAGALVIGLSLLVYCTHWSVSHLSSPWQQSVEAAVDSTGSGMQKIFDDDTRKQFAPAVDGVELSVKGSLLRKKVQRELSQPVRSSISCGNTTNQMVSAQMDGDMTVPSMFIPQSKNPCWWNKTRGSTGPQLCCLPYFLLAGVSKCGSTDIFSRLSGHPQVVPPKEKEPRWFDWRRHDTGKYPFNWYVSNFAQASWQISRDIGNFAMSNKVVGDGSPTYFWRNFHWDEYRGNEGCTEPRVVIPDAIQQILPQAKIIISFRNPIHSIYSKYLSRADLGAYRSPEHFHAAVKKDIVLYQDCLARFSVRSCAYNITLSEGAQVRLEKGLYAIFLADWFRVFPRKQVHIIRFEDYITDIAGHLQRMFEFLDLDAMTDSGLHDLAAFPALNTGKHYNTGHMLPATQQLLMQFYAVFNSQLASLLEDKRFLWLP